jgi:hypothetical protein
VRVAVSDGPYDCFKRGVQVGVTAERAGSTIEITVGIAIDAKTGMGGKGGGRRGSAIDGFALLDGFKNFEVNELSLGQRQRTCRTG